MTCVACSGIIEAETLKLKGVKSAVVNFATEKADFEFEKDFDLDLFFSLLNKLGYRAIDTKSREIHSTNQFFNRDFYKAFIALILASLTMFFAMVVHDNLYQAILTTILIIAFGKPYLFAILRLHSNMNTLIGLGAFSAYFYSLYLLVFFPHAHPYFEGGAFIIAFSLLGHYLDGLAKTKARSNLSSLFKMQIKFASRINNENKEINTPVVDLVLGDVIRIKPGEKFPLDGIVVSGETHADESMLTGESQVVSKSLDSKVFAGSLNCEGSVNIQITSSMHTTELSQVVSFVEKAQLKKAPIQKYADRIVKYFVPVILVIAILTFIIWYLITKDLSMAMIHMVSVLVIACPCALGLAVPMAIMLSTSDAAKNGLLISGGDVVEAGSHIDTMVFDKTGTLTEGRPELTEIVLFEKSLNEQDYKIELLKIAASSLQFSTHPLSQSITNAAVKNNLSLLDPDKFKSLTGLGIKATLNNQDIVLGNADLLTAENISFDIEPNFYSTHVGSYVFLAIDKKLIAAFVITDPIKKEAQKVVKNLQDLNINVWMVTGDHAGIAHKVGAELGIKPEFIRSGVKPVEKADFILELQSKKYKVAMIGDGINDAPALAKADLSLAMSTGSDVAIETAQVSVLDGKIESVADFFVRSKRSMKIIKENLILSSVYNLLCIPLAAGVFYPFFKVSLTPTWASFAMAMSSFSVIINSYRVKK